MIHILVLPNFIPINLFCKSKHWYMLIRSKELNLLACLPESLIRILGLDTWL